MEEMRTYLVKSRYLEPGGWVEKHTQVEGVLHDAGRKASEIAHRLDDRFGGDHFWSVDIYHLNDDGEPDGLGSYYQLFHGRLR